jgi:hypothetical protein
MERKYAMRTLIGLVLLAMSLAGCGQMYEQSGLIRWPDGTCAWPCIGGGGGSTVSGYSYRLGDYTYYRLSVEE